MKFHHTLLILLLIPSRAFSQDFKVTGGIGFPDLIHVGVGYQLTEHNELLTQFGSSFADNTWWTSTLEHRIYYRKSAKFQSLGTWFLGQRLTYSYERNDDYNWHSLFLNFSVGRNYYFNEHFGFSWDGGMLFWMLDKQFDNRNGQEVEDDSSLGIPSVLPSLRIQVFRRL